MAELGVINGIARGGSRATMTVMALSTAFTKLFRVRHPIALAPMGGSAGGALAAAVSRGGGLGLLGGARGDRDWLARELPVVAGCGKPWGAGFLCWSAGVGAAEQALEHGPVAVMPSFGDPSPFVERVRAAGAAVIAQVTDEEEARRAVGLGADVIVAQDTESGGHGARRWRATLPFVPVVVDLAAPVPVLAAGGIADGRGVAAALALGAAGALISTRFQSTAEAPVDPSITEAIIRGRGQDTERSSVLDIARESGWPAEYTARTLGHPYLDRRRGREAELAADPGPGRPTGPMWHAALCRRCRCGRVKASTSSPTGLPRLLSSPHWPLRPTTPWPELRDAERLLRAGLEGSVISLTAIGDLHVPDSREHLADKTEFVRLEPGVWQAGPWGVALARPLRSFRKCGGLLTR